MKKTVKAAAIQMAIEGMNNEANLSHASELIDKAVKEQHAELLVLPELANSGYVKGGDPTFSKEYIRHAEPVPGPLTEGLGQLARKHGVYIATGILEAHPQIPYHVYNSTVLIGPSGSIIGVHRKMHLPIVERALFYPGNELQVFRTELGNIAIEVCADSSVPEISRILTLQGAEIICVGYNVAERPGKPYFQERVHHVSVCRALENIVFFIGASRVGNDAAGKYLGHSTIAGPAGQTLAHSDTDAEEIVTAVLNEEDLIEARATFLYLRDLKPEVSRQLKELLPG
jgi:predicted amidohydrolase